MTALQPTARDEAIIALYGLGWSPAKIVRALKTSESYIAHLTVIPKRDQEIEALAKKGATTKELSEQFGLSMGRIREIVGWNTGSA